MITLLLIIVAGYIKAQNKLSLNDAISLTMENNFGIKVSGNEIKMAQNSATKGNAGLLPNLSAEGNSSISSINESGAANNTNTFNLGAGINLNYPIYEGGAGKHRFGLLKIQAKHAELQCQQSVENTIMQVINTYFSAANLLESVNTQRQSLKISEERLNRIKVENEFGNSTGLDVLNAQVDFNKDSIALMNLMHDYTAQKMSLVELIYGEWPANDFDVQTRIEGFAVFSVESLISQAKNNNSLLQLERNSLEQSHKNLQIAEAGLLPKLSLQSGYNYNSINSAFYSPQGHRGQLTTSLSLKIPIFDGGRRKSNIVNARLQTNNQQLVLQQNELKTEKQVRVLFQSYQNLLKNVAMETSNLEAVKQNLALSKELLQNGQITNTQFREAQQNLLLAQTNIAKAKFSIKILEYDILMNTGQLIDYLSIE